MESVSNLTISDEVMAQHTEVMAEDTAAKDELDVQINKIAQKEGAIKVQDFLALFQTYTRQAHEKVGSLDFLSATAAIGKGKILNPIHDEVSKTMKWGVWFEDNLPGLKLRTANTWRLLARRTDCHRHAALGEQCLVVLVSVTKGMKGEDPISTFLQARMVEYSPAETVSLEVKNKIEAAIVQAKKEKEKKAVREFRQAADKISKKGVELTKDEKTLKQIMPYLEEIHNKTGELLAKAKEI